jgi:RAB protein geranylgeranyltransferase component A
VKESCSQGFELIRGQCMPINSMKTSTEWETSSMHFEDMIVHEEQPVTELNITEKSGTCPEGIVHGICQKIQSSTSIEVTVELTTDHNENVGGVENIKGCPEGTEPDEQGACQQITPTKSTQITTDPKSFLKQDGSCPDNYKMIEGRCLYTKISRKSTSYPSGSIVDETVSIVIQPKYDNGQNSKIELVPVLSDNSCPEGTEYSEYGLCQKRARLSNSGLRMKADGSCPDDYELINSKCTYKNTTIPPQLQSTTTIETSESSTLAEEFDYRLQSEAISSTMKTNKIKQI